jgi:hypothetical protein
MTRAPSADPSGPFDAATVAVGSVWLHRKVPELGQSKASASTGPSPAERTLPTSSFLQRNAIAPQTEGVFGSFPQRAQRSIEASDNS